MESWGDAYLPSHYGHPLSVRTLSWPPFDSAQDGQYNLREAVCGGGGGCFVDRQRAGSLQ